MANWQDNPQILKDIETLKKARQEILEGKRFKKDGKPVSMNSIGKFTHSDLVNLAKLRAAEA